MGIGLIFRSLSHQISINKEKGEKKEQEKRGRRSRQNYVVIKQKVKVVHSMELVSTCDIDRDRNTRVARLGTGNRGHSALGKTL